MLPVIIPVVLALGAGAGFKVWRSKKPKGMTEERRKIYEEALKTLKDPVKLRSLADAFEKENLKAQAALLRKRAALRELPPDVKKNRQTIFRKAMTSTNQPEILKVAEAFANEGATGAAQALRAYAAGLTGQPKT